MAEYWGASRLAEQLGVATGTITKWIRRFAETARPFPLPDVEIIETGGRVTRGWSPERWDEIRLWATSARYELRRDDQKVLGDVIGTKYTEQLSSSLERPILRPRSADVRRRAEP